MKRLILGTAGHIDHGKTELVRALTGIETDRLKEEKERGISIELGFAFLDIGENVRVGVIDVPGHEKFVRQMVAGSGGVDLAALVIALDEGVMPQTREHMDILSLLGIKLGLVVLTKLDLVDDELAMLAEEDARSLIKNSFLEHAPVIRVSARTGEGIDNLRNAIQALASQVEDRPVRGLLRLPVDRVFSLKGHGTIVAGTLISGTLSVGDDVELLPGGRRSSVRSLQSHNRQEKQAFPGERVAVNLRGLEHSEAQRGEVVVHPGEFAPSTLIDVRLTALRRAPLPLKNRQLVRLHHYTSDVEARVILPEKEAIEPGQETMAQLRTMSPIVPSSGDRFVIRALSPSVTLGGGVILNPRGVRLKAKTMKTLVELDGEDQPGIVEALIRSAGVAGIRKRELLGLAGLPAKALDRILDALTSSRAAVRFDPAEERFVHADFVSLVKKKITDRLDAFHSDHPLREGMPRQELRSTLPGDDKLFKRVMEILTGEGSIIDQSDTVRKATHKIRLKEEEKGLKERIVNMIVAAGNSPPGLKEIIAQTGADPKSVRNLLEILDKEGAIVRVKEDLWFSSAFVNEVKAKLVEFIKRNGGITPSQFNEITQSSRKFNIPLLEHLDRERFTMRVGDQRVLRGSLNSAAGGKDE
jgi:selenocysteine-specific elongation factor